MYICITLYGFNQSFFDSENTFFAFISLILVEIQLFKGIMFFKFSYRSWPPTKPPPPSPRVKVLNLQRFIKIRLFCLNLLTIIWFLLKVQKIWQTTSWWYQVEMVTKILQTVHPMIWRVGKTQPIIFSYGVFRTNKMLQIKYYSQWYGEKRRLNN